MNTDGYFHTVFTENDIQIQRNENYSIYGTSFVKFANISNQTFTTKETDGDSLHI